MSDSHTMQIRVPKRLWERFKHVCNEVDTTPSESIREFMRAVTRESVEHKSAMDHIDTEIREAYVGPNTGAVASQIMNTNRRNAKALWHPDR